MWKNPISNIFKKYVEIHIYRSINKSKQKHILITWSMKSSKPIVHAKPVLECTVC